MEAHCLRQPLAGTPVAARTLYTKATLDPRVANELHHRSQDFLCKYNEYCQINNAIEFAFVEKNPI